MQSVRLLFSPNLQTADNQSIAFRPVAGFERFLLFDREKCGRDVGDAGAVAAEEDGDDVEEDFFVGGVFGDEAAGGEDEFAAFGFGHVFEGVEAIAFIEALYFDNPDRVAGIHDKVQLVVFAAPVAGDECHAKFLQVIQRGLLSRASECNLFHAAR